MNVNDVVVYIDRKGTPHNGLVKSLNQLHEGYLSLSYQDDEGRSIDVFDVPHMDHESRQEPNPDLPTFHINCWKYPDEEHNRAPKDHPMFDHPFEPPTKDRDGRIVPKPRPLLDAAIAEHQANRGPVTDSKATFTNTASAGSSSDATDAPASEPVQQSPEQAAAREHAVATAHVESQLPKVEAPVAPEPPTTGDAAKAAPVANDGQEPAK